MRPTCRKRTPVSQKAKNASEFVNWRKKRTARIEPLPTNAGRSNGTVPIPIAPGHLRVSRLIDGSPTHVGQPCPNRTWTNPEQI